MAEQISLMSVKLAATDRFTRLHAALEGMRIDLVILAEQALHTLHQQAEPGYSDVVVTAVPRPEGFVDILTDPVHTWAIPESEYYLPDWQRSVGSGGIFSFSFEHTLVKMPSRGDLTILSFRTFVQQCSRLDYINVCAGLSELAGLTDTSDND